MAACSPRNDPADRVHGTGPVWSESRIRPVVHLLAGRWVLGVLASLEGGPLRRAELRRQLPLVADKVLTETLRRLEEAGFVTRCLTPGVPPQVDYALTDTAMSLWPVLMTLDEWSATDKS
jgi:DNA-binding HxlR family transcriptional regulator